MNWQFIYIVIALAQLLSTRPAVASAAENDTLIRVHSDESLTDIAKRLLHLSNQSTVDALVAQIRHDNLLGDEDVFPGQTLRVRLGLIGLSECSVSPKVPAVVRGIYLGHMYSDHGQAEETAEKLLNAGANTIVFDIKNRTGALGYVSKQLSFGFLDVANSVTMEDVGQAIKIFHRYGFHVVGRIVCFFDRRLAQARPELVPRDIDSGAPWREKGRLVWVDPSKSEVQAYILELVQEAVLLGLDEIQLDYVRFPTEGDIDRAVFDFDENVRPRHAVITDFVGRVRAELAPSEVLLGADVFGIIAWDRAADTRNTGQHLESLLPLLDVVSPMLYPSHFRGPFSGMERPVDHPFRVVYEGCRRLGLAAERHGVVVRPWLQAFPYEVKNFGPAYVATQIEAAAVAGTAGFMLWNTGGQHYQTGIEALLQHGKSSGRRGP